MGLLTYTINRTCVVCAKPIKIRLLRLLNRILWGGYYFDVIAGVSEDTEYWECKACYNQEE